MNELDILPVESILNCRMTDFKSILELIEPKNQPATFEKIKENLNTQYIVRIKPNLERNATNCSKKLALKGQMILINNGENLLFLNYPFIATSTDFQNLNLFLSDLAQYDTTRQLIMLNQLKEWSIHVSQKFNELMTKKRTMISRIMFHKQKNSALTSRFWMPYLEDKNQKFIEFSDSTCTIISVAFFDVIRHCCPPSQVFRIVSNLFLIFDRLVDLYECRKISWDSSSYTVLADGDNHSSRMLNFAMACVIESKQIVIPQIKLPVMLNIAINTGPVFFGISKTGNSHTIITGDGFEVAKFLSKMEETPGRILLTSSSKHASSKSVTDNFEFSNNGYKIVQKNLATCTYMLEKNKNKTESEIIWGQKDVKSERGFEKLHENHSKEWLEFEKNMNIQLQVISMMQPKKPMNASVNRLANKWLKIYRNGTIKA